MNHRSVQQRALMVLVGVATVLAVSGVGMSPAAADGPTVTGGGASFPSLMINQWRADVSKPPYNIRINYSSAGSGFGRDKYITGSLDFGQSDISFLEDELPRVRASGRGSYVYVPVVAGALAFMFNVVGTNGQRITNLKLTANDACRIFTEPDIKWNDPSIVANNPGVPLPSTKARPVVRSDRSGTSYVLSEFCLARASAVWNKFVSFISEGNFGQDQYLERRQPISQWPSGYGAVSQAFASDGVASAVGNSSTGKDSITYIETGYTKVKRLPAAKVQNAAGVFTPPNPLNSTVALGFAKPNGDGTFKLSYSGTDPRAYFPSTYSYTIAQTKGFSPAKGKVLATYLNYAVCKGQDRAEPLLYSRLSSVLVNIALDATAKIPGAPARPKACAAPPPPKLVAAPPGANVQGNVTTQGGNTVGSGGNSAGNRGGGSTAGGANGAGQGGQAGGTGTGAGSGAGAGTGASGGTDGAGTPGQVGPDGSVTGATGTDGATGVDGSVDGAAAGGEFVGSESGAGTGSEVAAAGVPIDGGPGGPENSEVLFTLLLGAGIVAAGAAVAKGSRGK